MYNTDSVSIHMQEFQEIGHCGGQITIRVKTDENGRRGIQFGIRHSRPTPAAWFGIYTLPQPCWVVRSETQQKSMS